MSFRTWSVDNTKNLSRSLCVGSQYFQRRLEISCPWLIYNVIHWADSLCNKYSLGRKGPGRSMLCLMLAIWGRLNDRRASNLGCLQSLCSWSYLPLVFWEGWSLASIFPRYVFWTMFGVLNSFFQIGAFRKASLVITCLTSGIMTFCWNCSTFWDSVSLRNLCSCQPQVC